MASPRPAAIRPFPAIIAAVAKSPRESLLYVRVFRSIEGWGFHFLASKSPLPSPSAAILASRLPFAAVTARVEARTPPPNSSLLEFDLGTVVGLAHRRSWIYSDVPNGLNERS